MLNGYTWWSTEKRWFTSRFAMSSAIIWGHNCSNSEETKTQSIYATNVIIALSKSSNNQMKAFRPDPDERLNEVHPNYQQLSSLGCNSVSDTEVRKGAALKAFPWKVKSDCWILDRNHFEHAQLRNFFKRDVYSDLCLIEVAVMKYKYQKTEKLQAGCSI